MSSREKERSGMSGLPGQNPEQSVDQEMNVEVRYTAGGSADGYGTAEGRDSGSPETDSVWMLECNVDDCSGEALGYVMELLFDQGARDVWFSPIFMKKNRPAYTLHVICKEAEREELENIIFSGTTTIGIRRVPMERTLLKRFFLEADTCLGRGPVKMCRHQGKVYAYPEFESVKKLASENETDYQTVYHLLKEAAVRQLEEKEKREETNG